MESPIRAIGQRVRCPRPMWSVTHLVLVLCKVGAWALISLNRMFTHPIPCAESVNISTKGNSPALLEASRSLTAPGGPRRLRNVNRSRSTKGDSNECSRKSDPHQGMQIPHHLQRRADHEGRFRVSPMHRLGTVPQNRCFMASSGNEPDRAESGPVTECPRREPEGRRSADKSRASHIVDYTLGVKTGIWKGQILRRSKEFEMASEVGLETSRKLQNPRFSRFLKISHAGRSIRSRQGCLMRYGLISAGPSPGGSVEVPKAIL